MKILYISVVGGLGLVLILLGLPLPKAIYLGAGAGVAIALLVRLFFKSLIFAQWWSLTPLIGLFLAGVIFDQTQNWMLAATAFIAGFVIYFYCLTRSDGPEVS